MKAMIFAAGLATRLRPLTDSIPKALVPVGGKPLLQHVLDKLSAAGYDDITVNAHHFAGQIHDYLASSCTIADSCGIVDSPGPGVHISDESSLLRDTGGGILHARRYLEGDGCFLVHNVDILSNLDLHALAAAVSAGESSVPRRSEVQSGDVCCDAPSGGVCSEDSTTLDAPEVLATLVVSQRETSRYLLFDDDMRLVGWTNIRTGEVRSPYPNLDPSSCRRYAFSGIHMMSDEVFPLMEKMADSHSDAAVFPIMDFYLKHAATHVIRGYVPNSFRMVDVGKLDTLAVAETFVRELRP